MKTFLVLLLGILPACPWDPQQGVIAQVNGEKIRVGEFQQVLREIGSRDETSRRNTLDFLIEEKLLLQEAQKRGLRLSDEEKDPLIGLKSGYSDDTLREILQKQGITEAEWLNKQERRLLFEKLFDAVLGSSPPALSELQTAYRKDRAQFRLPEQSHCRQIVTSTRAKAEIILSLLAKGENFAELAQKYSESPDREKGGDLGFVSPGELPPMMDEACFRFEPGQTSGIVASAYGFHIFRVIERTPPRSLSFAEARPLLEKEWQEKNRERLLRPWLEKLHQSAKIEIDGKRLRETPFEGPGEGQ